MKIAIAGLGVMGMNHLRVARKKGFDILSTYDPRVTNNSYKEFIATLKNVDGMIIASSTNSHIKIMYDALNENNNLKILCEKPVTKDIADLRLQELANNYEDSVLIGQIERFNPVCLKLKQEILKQGEIIQIKTRRVGNTPAREKISCREDIGIHDLDFSCFITERIPNKIDMFSDSREYHENLFYRIGQIQVNNEISWRYPKKDRTFEVLTENGLFKGNFFNQTLDFTNWTGLSERVEVEKEEPLSCELEHFHEVVRNQCLPRVKITDHIKILELLKKQKEVKV
jgi:predicted dehydrogenase